MIALFGGNMGLSDESITKLVIEQVRLNIDRFPDATPGQKEGILGECEIFGKGIRTIANMTDETG